MCNQISTLIQTPRVIQGCSFFSLFFSFYSVCLLFITAEFSKGEGETRVSPFQPCDFPCFYRRKQFYLKGMLHWRSTELKNNIENYLSCRSKCVLETVCHKAMFYVHTNCIKTSHRSTGGRKFTVYEMKSHIKLLKAT